MLQLQGRPRNESTTYPPWTSHRCHTALTPLEAHATAAVGNDVRLAQCESIAELRVAVRGRLDILRPRNGESVTLVGKCMGKSKMNTYSHGIRSET